MVKKKVVKKTAKKAKKKIPPIKPVKSTKAINSLKPTKKIIKRGKTERVPTGIKDFDKLIEGGFEKNSTNLLVGSSGSGKSIFAVQFLIEGLRRGEKCLYITFEEKKKEFYENMLRFKWDLEKFEKQGKFVFLEYTPEKVKTMLEEGGGIIESIVLTKKMTRLVIDSITSFELLFEEEIEKREAALSLFNMLRKWNCTSLLTYQGDPSREKKPASRTLEFESDSISLLYFVREGKQRDRFIEVLKMRGTSHSRNIYPLCIGNTGISITSKPCSEELKF
jgi:circadian clock protein KaiC